MTERAPAEIHHKERRPSNFENIIFRAAINVDLTKNQTKLLTYYGQSAEGFKPAAKTIETKTGIKSNKISETRQALKNKGLIDFTPYKRITVNWPLIQTFAALTEPIHITNRDRRANRESGHNPYGMQSPKAAKRIYELDDYNRYKPLVKANLTQNEIKALHYYEGLTVAGFAEIFGQPQERQIKAPEDDIDFCYELAMTIATEAGITIPKWIG